MPVTPSRSSRKSNVFTINVPQSFKKLVLDKAQTFGGASEIVALALDELALKIKKFTNKLSIIEEYSDFIKIEVLLMRKYFEEKQNGVDTKLSFRLRDQIALTSLNYVKKKTGWNTSKVVRLALLLYLFSNFAELLSSNDVLPFLTCPHCGFITFDQRLLSEHIRKFHIKFCEYCGKPYLVNEEHSCPQKALILESKTSDERAQRLSSDIEVHEISEILTKEQELLARLEHHDREKEVEEDVEDITIESLIKEKSMLEMSEDTLSSLSKEIEEIGGPFVSLDDGDSTLEEDEKESIDAESVDKRKDKKDTKKSLDKLQSEIKEMLKELKEDGLLD